MYGDPLTWKDTHVYSAYLGHVEEITYKVGDHQANGVHVSRKKHTRARLGCRAVPQTVQAA
jgi:hypothetical protein